MKHDLRFLVHHAIPQQTTNAFLDEVVRSNNDEKPIEDPEVIAMRKDYAELRAQNREVKEKDEPEGRRAHRGDAMSDHERERISVWIQTKDDLDDERTGAKVAQKSTTETEEQTRFREYKHHQFIKRWGLLFESHGKDEEWFIPSPSILDESDAEYLCDMCRHIDFRALFSRRGLPGNQTPGPTLIELYGLPRLLKQENCSFCSLLRQGLIDQSTPEEISSAQALDATTLQLTVLDEGPEYALRLEVEFGGVGDTFPRLVVQQMAAEGNGLPLQGLRVRQDIADIQRIRGWLKVCEEEHPQLADQPHQALGSGSATLRLIDVVDNCVLSVATPCRYVCLSYVWGKGAQTLLTAETRPVLEAPGGIVDGSLNLNRTIQGAIQVTRDAGLRYIWIDALCIVQDDAADKAANISRMSSIYGNATLTIVASTNSNPADGLPGVSTALRPRAQATRNVQGMTLVVACQDPRRPYTEIEDSVWNSRAWTFQERHLSQRSVYFTNSQMCFTCPHGTAMEDTLQVLDAGYQPPPLNDQTRLRGRLHDLHTQIWDDPTQSQYPNKAIATKGEATLIMQSADPDNPDAPHPAPTPVYEFSPIPDSSETGMLKIEGETLWKTYREAVSMYTMRKMTWQSDAINAFTGVADLISQGTNTTFWYGLPEFAFDRALLWQPGEELKRRVKPGSDEPLDIPSWSWAAWEGHTLYRGRGWYNAITFAPVTVVKWLEKKEVSWYVDAFAASGDRTAEEIEAFAAEASTKKLLLSAIDPYDLFRVTNSRDGWTALRDTARNEHYFTHGAYPSLRFTYPISLPSELFQTIPSSDGTLHFIARKTPAQFTDMSATEPIQRTISESFLQIGLNDNARSTNARRPWQHIIYHQGYRAGFLSLNRALGAADHSASYALVAMSRDSISHVAPPPQGWDAYWQCNPRVLQATLFFGEEWGDADERMRVPVPDWEAAPEDGAVREDGDPHWDEGRFGEIKFFDVYNVLLVRRGQGEHEDDEAWERVGAGKVNVRAFRYSRPKEELVILR